MSNFIRYNCFQIFEFKMYNTYNMSYGGSSGSGGYLNNKLIGKYNIYTCLVLKQPNFSAFDVSAQCI